MEVYVHQMLKCYYLKAEGNAYTCCCTRKYIIVLLMVSCWANPLFAQQDFHIFPSPVFEIRMFLDELYHYLTNFIGTRFFFPISNLKVSFC